MNLKKLEEKEVIFIDQPFSDEERKYFSELLKKKKEKTIVRKVKEQGSARRSVAHSTH